MADTSTRDHLVAQLRTLLGAPLAALDLDLEDIDIATAGKRRLLRIAVDKDGGVGMDEIADATREVSLVLDTSEVMGERQYTLEVGSPGVDRPLTEPRHWRRNQDRQVKVKLGDGSSFTGRVSGSDEDTARLEVAGRERVVRLADVVSARVQIEFKRKDDT